MGGRLRQDLQEDWAFLGVTTFVECVNENDEGVLWVARKIIDEVKEEGVLYRL